jgi:hypothetical protein
MRKGEKGILIGIGVFAILAMSGKAILMQKQKDPHAGKIPFYSDAPKELATQAATLVRKHNCRGCHVYWGKRDIMRAVPAPSLDGIGSLKTREWLMTYLSAENPQEIVPTRLKKEFQMPSFANIPDQERTVLVDYLASMKVEDWYLPETKKREYEKLTGKKFRQ